MMHKEFLAYREVADIIEDDYYDFQTQNKDIEEHIHFLEEKLSLTSDIFSEVCLLRLLCGELATYEAIRGVPSADHGSAAEKFRRLYMLASFDPLGLIACASYYLYDLNDAGRAVNIAIYASFIAEHVQAHVRDAHQTLFRASCSAKRLDVAAVSLRRIIEYVPSPESPDPAIERDVIELVRENNFDPELRRAFFEVVSRKSL